MAADEKGLLRRLKTARDLGKFMAEYYYELDGAAKNKSAKIAWCTSVGPAELLRAMGFLVYFPETHSAMLGSTRMATDLIPKANAVGYSPEICSYLTADIGACLAGVSPLSKAFPGITGPPPPDVLVYNTNQCRDVEDWFEWYGRRYQVPVVGIETHRNVSDVTDDHVISIKKQMESMVEPLEKVAGAPFEMDRLRETVRLSRECSDLWKQVLESATASPSPLSFFDSTTLMGAAVVGRGTPKANAVYKLVLEELNERIAGKTGAIEKEKFRLYWDGMPVWGRLRAHAELFAGLKTAVVASTYCSSWIFTALSPEDHFASMARAYTELFIVRSDSYKERYIQQMLKLFQCDGIVYHDAKTCPNNTNCRYGMPQRLQALTGIPSVTIHGDLNDLRLLSDEQTKTNIEAFIEQLEER